MDKEIFQQLAELAESFNKIGLKPVICGGLGIYLCFHKSKGEAQRMIRATNDIDLMITKTQVLEKSRCNAIAEIITDDLEYIVCQDGKHFHFEREPDQRLDILAPRIEGFETERFRIKLVRSKLHGHITEEARYIEEDLRTITLSDVSVIDKKNDSIEVQVPSPTNFLILKLCAFDDRVQKGDTEHAQTHAFDIYITIMLTTRDDYLEGQEFLSRHRDSDIIRRAQLIVSNKFSAVDQAGWRHVLEASDFYPDLSRGEKESRLDEAKRRLVKCFNVFVP